MRKVNSRLSSLPRKRRKVHVPAGKDHAEFLGVAVGASWQIQGSNDTWPEQRGNGDGARWLNDDFHAFPNQRRRRNNLLFADEEDAIHVTPQDGKRSRRERGAQAVGDGVAGVLRLQRTRGQGAVGVIRAFGLAAEYADIGTNPFGAEASPAEQSAATDRGKHCIQVTEIFQQLLCSGGLSSDDAVVSLGIHQIGAGFRLDTIASCFSRRDRRLAANNFSAVTLDGFGFHGGRPFFFYDPRGRPPPPRGAHTRGPPRCALPWGAGPRSLLCCLGA